MAKSRIPYSKHVRDLTGGVVVEDDEGIHLVLYHEQSCLDEKIGFIEWKVHRAGNEVFKDNIESDI